MSGQSELLISSVDRNIEKYKKLRDKSRVTASAIRLCAILLSSTVTIILGVKGYFPDATTGRVLSIAAVVASAGLTALTSWESFTSNGELWVRRMKLLAGYYAIRDQIQFSVADGSELTDDEVRQFFVRYQELRDIDEKWFEKRERSITSPLQGRL